MTSLRGGFKHHLRRSDCSPYSWQEQLQNTGQQRLSFFILEFEFWSHGKLFDREQLLLHF